MQSGDALIVAIQGELGAFSHEAALELVGAGVEILPRASFDALFEAVLSGKAHRALVPIENSLVGSIHENYDRLRALPLQIVAETQLRIEQCLIARPGASLGSIRRVVSHPVALDQCRRFFVERPHIESVLGNDTAGSVKDLVQPNGLATQAAIASAMAARLYGAQILLKGIEDDPQNYTRFLLLGRDPGPLEAASKTSVVFALENAPGALHRAVGAFARRGVDLTKIESRPLRGRPWQYAFYLDALGEPGGAVGAAMEELRAMSSEFRILGSYPEGLSRNGAPVSSPASERSPTGGS
jgi:prephenate dehydratase